MPINTALLIEAPMLQDFLIDKDGTPMAGGTITLYQDNSRTTLKNWYYQSGTPGNYTYIPLPNPLTLSAAGTITDINGVDTLPFYYPFSELDPTIRQPYYITIVNHAQTNQITRANFPFMSSSSGGGGIGGSSFDNYIINNGFWRNVGTMDLSMATIPVTVAPSQHDGFSQPDITFLKNKTGATDIVTFTKFPLTTTPILTGDITPEFYVNHDCSGATTGETQKNYYFPISLHVNTLASVPFTATIQGQNIGGTGSGQNTINLFIYQDTGSGTTPPAPIPLGSITLSTSWQKYTISSVFPGTTGLVLGNGGDDALYLIVQMPLNTPCSINFTKPSIYLSNTVPTNNFLTYDEVDAVINSPRTGDIRTSLNTFQPYGWLPMNDGTIGSASSGATTRAMSDTWQLYNLIWTNVLDHWAPVSGGRGGTAISDFNANKTINLTKSLGRILTGENPQISKAATFTTNYPTSNTILTVASNTIFVTGSPVQLTNTGGALPTGLSANTIYFAIYLSATTLSLATTLENALALTAITFTSNSTGTSSIQSALGATIGTSTTALSIPNMPAHNHPGSTASIFGVGGGGALATPANISSTGLTTLTIASQGSGTAFSIQSPTTYMNVFIKM
jgi:hypothetical protein